MFRGHCHKQSISGTAGLPPSFPYRLAVFAKGCFVFIILKVNLISVAAFVGQVRPVFVVLLLYGFLRIDQFAFICLWSISSPSLVVLISVVPAALFYLGFLPWALDAFNILVRTHHCC